MRREWSRQRKVAHNQRRPWLEQRSSWIPELAHRIRAQRHRDAGLAPQSGRRATLKLRDRNGLANVVGPGENIASWPVQVCPTHADQAAQIARPDTCMSLWPHVSVTKS